MNLLGNYSPNPNYGDGVFKRRIRLIREAGEVFGQLEDCNHGFKVRLGYRDGQVTSISPEYPRIPFSTCSDAGDSLLPLIGCSIDMPARQLSRRAGPLSNCTHLLDLTLLCIAHASRKEGVVQYDVVITDEKQGVADLRVHRNDELIHHWQSSEGGIHGGELHGKPLFHGFSVWAVAAFHGLELESAIVLARGYLVSIGRMFDIDKLTGRRAIDESDRHACYTFSPQIAADAIRLPNTVRDFGDNDEQLLKFL